jgi:hypothetical protein
MPTEIVESRQIYRGFIALRLATLRVASVIPFPEPTGRRQTLDEETHFDPPAIRRLLDRFAVAASERRQARRALA